MGLFSNWRVSKRGAVPAAVAAPNDQAEALIEQGNALEEAGRLGPALERYEAAIAVAPGFARGHLNQGNVRLAAGDTAGALASYAQALVCDPAYAGAHFNLGNVYLQSGRPDEALASYLKAAELNDAFVDAHVAIGGVLDDLGRTAQAIASYRRALALAPDYAQVHSNLGNALKAAGRFDEAIESHRRALEIDPSLAQAHNNLGNALKDVGRLALAEASYRQALALQPGNLHAFSNLLFVHNYGCSHPPAQLLDEARAFSRSAARGARRYGEWLGTADGSRSIRVGLVSGDLRDHPVGYFIESVAAALAAQAGQRMQLIAYPTARCEDAVAARIRSHCHTWRPVAEGHSDEQFAAQVHADAIDILIDLSGHTSHNRLSVFAWKPSPVQVSWLGYFATTGVDAIDYLIADAWTLPQAQATAFTETIWRLPETRLCFTPPDPSPPVGELPAASGEPLTFACFNNLSKVNDAVIALWARVLAAIPASRLLLKAPQLQVTTVHNEFAAAFAAHGIGAERLLLEGLSARFDYLARYGSVDIALDPFPFPGGTTTVEALWMGVPVLTLAGATFLSRQGVGLLMNAGLPGWIADDPDHYVALAVAHAGDLARLAALRAGLRQRLRASPIMDAPRFAEHLERALREMWQRWCRAQQQPAA